MASPVMIEVSPRLSMSTETCPAVCGTEVYESKACERREAEECARKRQKKDEFTREVH